MRKYLFYTCLISLSNVLYAQNTRDVQTRTHISSRLAQQIRNDHKPLDSKADVRLRYDKAIKAYEKSLRKDAKERRKMLKKYDKPRYKDPTYFGHKRKPKIRPKNKRKLCKCGVYH